LTDRVPQDAPNSNTYYSQSEPASSQYESSSSEEAAMEVENQNAESTVNLLAAQQNFSFLACEVP